MTSVDAHSRPDTNITILIVDDESLNRKLLEAMLLPEGYRDAAQEWRRGAGGSAPAGPALR